MIYKITIGDNDYNFIMQQAIKYVIECFKYDEYLSFYFDNNAQSA